MPSAVTARGRKIAAQVCELAHIDPKALEVPPSLELLLASIRSAPGSKLWTNGREQPAADDEDNAAWQSASRD